MGVQFEVATPHLQWSIYYMPKEKLKSYLLNIFSNLSENPKIFF